MQTKLGGKPGVDFWVLGKNREPTPGSPVFYFQHPAPDPGTLTRGTRLTGFYPGTWAWWYFFKKKNLLFFTHYPEPSNLKLFCSCTQEGLHVHGMLSCIGLRNFLSRICVRYPSFIPCRRSFVHYLFGHPNEIM
jgi:hypothetical protein